MGGRIATYPRHVGDRAGTIHPMTAADLIDRFGSPLYVYEEAGLRSRCRQLVAALPSCALLYAMKANANPSLLSVIREEGLGIDAVSIGEVMRARRVGFATEQISYNGNNVTDEEMGAVRELGVHVTVDSLSQLERYGRLFPGTDVGLRLNPDIGEGHHDHVITGGPEAKFGVDHEDIEAAHCIASRHGLIISGLHQHVGSGILEVDRFVSAMEVMLEVAERFSGLRFVDFGGGFGVGYKPDEEDFDVAKLGAEVSHLLARFRAKEPDVVFRFEPGRWIIAPCGTLYVTVTSVKRGKRHTFVGTDSGLNHLLRPALYGSWHAIENVSRPDAPAETVAVAGNICESGDLFCKGRAVPKPEEGDVLAIRDVGAYGWSMASSYNLRPRPAEVLVRPGGPQVIREREPLDAINH